MTSKVIFFDIDGTLLNTGGAGQHAMERTLIDEFRIDFPFEGVLTAGRTDRGITDEIFARYDLQNTQENRDRFRAAYLEQLPDSLNAYPAHLLPNVEELLKALAEQSHVTLSLITGNYADAAWIKLKHFGLDHYFNFGGFGDHNANRNDVARSALNIAGQALKRPVMGTDTMVIGDTPADIHCARSIGASVIAVATGVYDSNQLAPESPDHLCEDFKQTGSIVETILALLA